MRLLANKWYKCVRTYEHDFVEIEVILTRVSYTTNVTWVEIEPPTFKEIEET